MSMWGLVCASKTTEMRTLWEIEDLLAGPLLLHDTPPKSFKASNNNISTTLDMVTVTGEWEMEIKGWTI